MIKFIYVLNKNTKTSHVDVEVQEDDQPHHITASKQPFTSPPACNCSLLTVKMAAELGVKQESVKSLQLPQLSVRCYRS